VIAPGRSAFCSGVASNVARRSRTICQGGNSPCTPRLADIPPNRLRELLTRHIHQPSALLMVIDRRCGNANSHSTSPPTTPRSAACPSADRSENAHSRSPGIWTAFSARQQRRRRARRHRHHHGIVWPDGDGVVAKLQFANAFADIANIAQLMLELDAGALVLQQFESRVRPAPRSSPRARSAAGKPGPLPAASPAHRAGKSRGPSGGSTFSAASKQRLHQPW